MPKNKGAVALVGRPNVGKSTLINALLAKKVSIISNLQQTTRTINRAQSTLIADKDNAVAWLDTPGWQKKHGGQFNRLLNKSAESAVMEADVVLFVTVAGRWLKEDQDFLQRLPTDKPIIAVLNKTDKLADKMQLLPLIAQMNERANFAAIVPICALNKKELTPLKKEIEQWITPTATSDTASTVSTTDTASTAGAVETAGDQSAAAGFYAAEIVREKLFHRLSEELPYSVGVVTDKIEEQKNRIKLSVTILVLKESHKPIIIGKGGELLKRVGTSARLELQKYFKKNVFLSLVVRVENWQTKPDLLNKMRIGD